MKYLTLILLLIITLSSCKTKEENLKNLLVEKSKYNKFDDYYSNNVYFNKSLGLKIEFDNSWAIKSSYADFEELQKKYASFFSSNISEVLFVGNNDDKKIGIRCTVEKLGLNNDKYFEKIKEISRDDITNFQIKIQEQKEITLTNVKAYHFIYETIINANNVFIFDSVLFKKDVFNYRIDSWIKKSSYSNFKDYILAIYQTIDFGLIKVDNTSDTDNSLDTLRY